MDLLTHALAGAAIGVLLARCQAPRARPSRALLAPLLAGAIAACAPDIDYVLFPLDPPRFLAHWHRGPTHSLLLLPLWAWLLSRALHRFAFWRQLPLLLICSTAWLSHLALDLLNSYGILLLSPFDDWRPALHWTFELDPWLTVILALLLAASLLPWWRSASVITAVTLGLYIGQLQRWHSEAIQIAARYRDAHALTDSELHAFPQPLLAHHRHLVVQTPTQYCHSFQKLSPALPLLLPVVSDSIQRSLQHYLPPTQADWRCFAPFVSTPFTSTAANHDEIQQRWLDARLQYFRDLAVLPMLHSVADTGTERCIWFSELRYDWPVLPATFRYGFCRQMSNEEWRYFRLRYWEADEREAL